ncbi:amino acid permease [Furfurilactobacillus siliginis]|nr:amino acid permease [Furfurilactobacillus siliginis]GEK28105.1 glutamate:gamma-aminobutyrate antiporter [Furfurilactobacillus siliginis]
MKTTTKLSAFGFFTLTAAMLMSADEYPAFAQSGLLATGFLILAGLLWFLPVALVSAQMATMPGWGDGGIYTWVKGSLGQRSGFIAVFFQWLQITVNFITMIYFIIGVLAFAVDMPALNSNPWLKLALFLLIYWVMTAIQLRGINGTDKVVKWTFLFGIVLPALILLGLSVTYLLEGHHVQFVTNFAANRTTLTTHFSLTSVVPFVLAFTGIEASAAYVNNLRNARRNYPLILLILVLFAITLDSFGGLSVAAVVPAKALSLNQGVIEAINKMVHSVTVGTFTPVVKGIGLLMAIGMLGEISSWIVGPVRSLLVTAEDEILPARFNQVNKQQVPVHLVFLQGGLVSIIAFILTIGFGGNNAAFSMAMSLTVMLYLVMYILMFIAFLNLVRKGKMAAATFRIPGNKVVHLLLGLLGLGSSMVVFTSTFLPTASSHLSTGVYAAIMSLFFLTVLGITLWLYSRRRTQSTTKTWHIRHRHLDEVPRFTQMQGRGEHVLEQTEQSKTKQPTSP